MRSAPALYLRSSLHFLVVLLALLASTASVASQTCVSPPPGIVAWWPLDEASGTGAADIAGSNPGIHVNGPTPATGEVDGALHFTRPQYVGAADSELWAFGRNDFAIEFWANFDGPGSGSLGHPGDIFIGNDEGPGTLDKWFFALGGGVLNFHINGPSVGSFFLVRAPFAPTPGQWYHLAVTRSINTYTIFVNGNPIGSETNIASLPNPSAPLTIGQAETIAGASGFMDGLLDEVTIYNRALTQNELAAITNAGNSGKCRELAIATKFLPSIQFGKPASYQFISQFGIPTYSWSITNGTLPSGMELSPKGAINGTPIQPGSFPFTVRVTDGGGHAAEKAFTLDVLLVSPPPTIRTHKTATLAVPGRTHDQFIAVENVGSETAENVQVFEFLDDSFSFIKADPPAQTYGLANEGVLTNEGVSVVTWEISSLPPGEAMIILHQEVVAPSTPLGEDVGQPTCTEVDLLEIEACVKETSLPIDCDIVAGIICAACGPLCAAEPFSFLICVGCLAGCYNQVKQCSSDFGNPLEKCFKDQGCEIPKKSTTGAIDPNEKAVIARRFVQPEQLLVYPIHFENIGEIEARDVFVTDTLDPVLDITTLDILTPSGASFDAATRRVSWSLLGRNLQPQETGNLLLSIRPIPGLPSGTEIRNKARIQFEVFEPLDTNEVVSIIDNTRPICTMTALPPKMSSPSFSLSWTAVDEIGEIASCSVLVSVNDGSFAPLLERTQNTGIMFMGEPGKEYAFLCIAADTAGNVEAQDAVAETSTVVEIATPVVQSISPVTGPTEGGTLVTISGSDFAPGAMVHIGGVAATDVEVVDAMTIRARTGPHETGTVDVSVTNSDGLGATLPQSYFFYSPPLEGFDFFTLTPCRVIDTRWIEGSLGGPALAPSEQRLFVMIEACGIPSSAKAIVANLTVVSPTGSGYLSVFPGNAFDLGTSVVNFSTGQTRATNGIMLLAVDGSGSLGIVNFSGGSVHLVLDVSGYFE